MTRQRQTSDDVLSALDTVGDVAGGAIAWFALCFFIAFLLALVCLIVELIDPSPEEALKGQPR